MLTNKEHVAQENNIIICIHQGSDSSCSVNIRIITFFSQSFFLFIKRVSIKLPLILSPGDSEFSHLKHMIRRLIVKKTDYKTPSGETRLFKHVAP